MSGPPPSLHSLAYRYVDTRRREGSLSKASQKTVWETLRAFVDIVGDPAPQRFNRRHVSKWRDARQVAPATLRSQLSIVRAWCRWMVENGHIKRDPTMGSPRIPQPRRLPRGLQAEQVGVTLRRSPDARARLVLSLMAQEGLRCCEVASLELGDIDFANRLMRVVGKGGHERALPITAATMGCIADYRTEQPISGGFLVRSHSQPHRGISAKYVSRLVSQWLHGAGVDASAHALRHTAATDVLRGGGHVRDVQRMLGHKHLATTELYMPLVVNDLRDIMEGRDYRSAG